MSPRFYELFRRLLILHEGISLTAYKDKKGKWTIGIGRNLTARGITDEVARATTCTKEEARAWLYEDMHAVVPLLADRVQENFGLNWDTLYVNQQLALADMAFCMGVGSREKKTGVLGFARMIGFLKDGNHQKAADELLDSTFARDLKQRARRLAEMLRTGQIPQEIRQ